MICVFSRAKNSRITHKHFRNFDNAVILAKKLLKKKRDLTIDTSCNWSGRK